MAGLFHKRHPFGALKRAQNRQKLNLAKIRLGFLSCASKVANKNNKQLTIKQLNYKKRTQKQGASIKNRTIYK